MSDSKPPEAVGNAHAEIIWAVAWRDVWTAPVVIALAMVVVGLGTMGTLADGEQPSVLAWMNGAAAVITAVAALSEARRNRADTDDHEVRLRVLESK